MVLMNFKELLKLVTDLQYAERVVLQIENAKFFPDDTDWLSSYISEIYRYVIYDVLTTEVLFDDNERFRIPGSHLVLM